MTNDNCGCCEGLTNITPLKTANRPGLSTLAYRVGTHATFLETMKARLSSLYLDLPRDEFDEHGQPKTDRVYPLRSLTTRTSDDPAIALLDCWATVGAVLTFYQERVANEGYLNTATERRSILELARLVGYALRPGVSASTFLAYTIDPNSKEPVEIPAGAKVQSVPNPGELPQTFETSEALEARAAWNNLKPRQTRPQIRKTIVNGTDNRVYLKGTSTNLKENDPLLIDFGSGDVEFFRILKVTPDTTLDRTLVTLADWQNAAKSAAGNFKARVLRLAQSLQDTSNLRRTTAKAEMVGRVVDHLKTLENQAKSTGTEADLADFLNHETLPRLQEELAVAEADVKFSKIKQWLEPAVKELQAATRAGQTSIPKISVSSFQANAFSVKNDPLIGVMQKLTLPPSVPPRNTLNLSRDVKTTFAQRSDVGTQLVTTFQPALHATLSAAISNGTATADSPVRVYALRVKSAPFGNNAPFKITGLDANKKVTTEEWSATDMREYDEQETIINLDASYDKILPGSWLVLDMAAVEENPHGGAAKVQDLIIAQAQNPNAQLSRAAYNIAGKSTRIQLVDARGNVQPWFKYINDTPGLHEGAVIIIRRTDFQIIRRTAVYAQSEELPLAEEPIESEICGGASDWIELDELYSDLKSGRWLIVTGERTDITVPDPNQRNKPAVIRGVNISELVMLDDVIQDISSEDGTPSNEQTNKEIFDLPAEKTHTFIKFAKNLEYCYRRDTITIYGNVVKATHGETRKEVLGSGDGSQALQSFALKQPPLTFVAAPNPTGVDSTLKVYVNEVQWHAIDSLAGLVPTDRDFITRTDDAGKTTVIFGNGKQGARLPTGRENVRAEYRQGLGKAGNVTAGQLSQLLTRPLGVKDVINPLRASGGADKENRDQARKNAPLAVLALDRLVSVSDYADFTRTFAGIGKAAATTLPVAQRQIVHVTIAGADDIPIETSSDLYRNLLLALRQYGDPYQPFQVDLRELLLLVVSANVNIQPDYVWENVVTQVRAKLLDAFSFERRDLGQSVFLSEAISTMQAVPGVAYVDIDLLAAIPEKIADHGTRRLLTPQEITEYVNKLVKEREGEQGQPDAKKKHPVSVIPVGLAELDHGTVRPAQLALLSPSVPDTLILNRI